MSETPENPIDITATNKGGALEFDIEMSDVSVTVGIVSSDDRETVNSQLTIILGNLPSLLVQAMKALEAQDAEEGA